MAIIDAERVNSFLSNPQWNAQQWEECELLCGEVEGRLAGRLGGAPITPIPWAETVSILGSGLIATTYPVASVSKIDATEIPEGDPLPEGWIISQHRLRRDPALVTSSLTLSAPMTGLVSRVAGYGSVSVSYMAGWGDVPALRDTLVRKVGAIMVNRHDDSVIITADGEARQPRQLREDWTNDEIEKDLGTFRALGAWR